MFKVIHQLNLRLYLQLNSINTLKEKNNQKHFETFICKSMKIDKESQTQSPVSNYLQFSKILKVFS